MSQTEHDPWAEDTIYAPPEGIGGWLLIPVLQLVAVPVLTGLSLLKLVKPVMAALKAHQLAAAPIFDAVTIVSVLASLALAALGAYCLFKVLRRRAALPALITKWYWLSIAISVLSAVQFAVQPEAFQTIVDATATSGSVGRSATINILMSGFWILYFANSERVKNSFTR